MTHHLPAHPSKHSTIPHLDGGIYTRYLAGIYDILTTISGWRRKLAAAALEGIAPGKLLDIGCGTGYVMYLAAQQGCDVVGADPSAWMLAKAAKRYGFAKPQLVEAPAHHLPFPDAHFDVVTAAGVLAYVSDMESTAREIARVLKPGGHLRIIDHAVPTERGVLTALITPFVQVSGYILHDHAWYFRETCRLVSHKTLGRGGYVQLFDFERTGHLA